MLRQWIAYHTRRALMEYRQADRDARLLDGTPLSGHADRERARRARRMARWASLWRAAGRPAYMDGDR